MLIKTPAELAQIKKGGHLMGIILSELYRSARPGVSTWDVDKEAEAKIIASGGTPAFKGYTTRVSDTPFPSTICASVNTDLVHAIARKEVKLKKGDIFSIDIGMEWPFKKETKNKEKGKKLTGHPGASRGYFTDTAVTFALGEVPAPVKKLLAVTKQALEEGIKAAKPGNSVAAIGKAVESYVRSQGNYGIVRDLVGHGVGHAVHEDPHIPNYYDPALEKIILKPGMVIAIEPMISLSNEYRVQTKPDGWTIEMVDQSLCAHFEHTLIITSRGNTVVTRRPGEDKEVFW